MASPPPKRVPTRQRIARTLASVLGLAGLVVVAATVLAPALSQRSPRSHSEQPRPRPVTVGRLVFDEEFTGPAGSPPSPSRWRAVTGDWSGGDGELEYYTPSPSNVALDGHGHLAITARRQTIHSRGKTYPYSSGRLQTKGLFQTTYGRLEARIRIPPGAGMWPAFWALGSDIDSTGWPGSGEIDVMENHGNDPHTVLGSIHGPFHHTASGYALSATKRSPTSLANAFHVYDVDWSPGQIVFKLDGKPYSVRMPATLGPGRRWVFDKPFYLLLNLAVGGQQVGDPTPSTHFPAPMLVDWVRVYRLSRAHPG